MSEIAQSAVDQPDVWSIIESIGKQEQTNEELGSERELYAITPEGLVPATHADRLAQCGVLRHKTNLKTGERFGYYQTCGLSDCPTCRRKRANKEQRAIQAYVDNIGRPLKKVELPTEEAKEFTKGLSASCYRRYPQGEMITILHTEPDREGEEVGPETLDWDKLVWTPKGQNVSGKMGRGGGAGKPDNPKLGESKNIRHEAVILEDNIPERDEIDRNIETDRAWELATLATCELAPDIYTITYCAAARMAKFKEFLAAAGLSVKFSVYTWEKVHDGEIDWKPYNESIRKKYAKQSVINPNMLGTTLAENRQHLPELAAVEHWEQGKPWKKGDEIESNCPF